MTETANKLFVMIVVIVVILTAFLTWKISEWQNENADSQKTVAAAIYSTPNGNRGMVNINVLPAENTEVK